MAYSCSRCTRTFNSDKAANQHMGDKNHFAYECHVCYETYPSCDNREYHEKVAHCKFFCKDCHREFKSANGLRMKKFATGTGITHHIERGSCPKAQHMNHDELYRFVKSKDPGGIIAKNLLEWHGSDQFEATGKAWNGNGYECYLCNRVFNSLAGLNQHLKSPVHQKALYHCPQGGCRKDFTTLAALINHLESEACGFIKFHQVQKNIHGLISGDRLLM